MMTRTGTTDSRKWRREQAELEAILASESFRRAPRLHQFLRYVCEKSFRGESGEIKEYTIAVEALGRPPEFDHTKDAIVRVEAHRLRRRLAEYYANEGAGRPLRLVIPPGGYQPTFQPAAAIGTEGEPQPPASAPSARKRWFAAAALVLVMVSLWFLARTASHSTRAGTEPAPPVAEAVVQISAGRPTGRFIDGFGRDWQADQFVTGGRAEQHDEQPIARAWTPRIFSTRRAGRFSYTIPLDPGVYEVSLYFAETGGPDEASQRLFDVYGNGQPWLERFSVLADAGGTLTEAVKVFRDVQPAPDGFLHLDFRPLIGEALLNGIEIHPGIPGRLRPIRILAGRSSYHHDVEGNAWSPDRFVEGGIAVLRRNRVTGTDRPNLFISERYGRFTYVIPVAPGRYRVNLYFAETWFGEENHGGGGDGSRLFDVHCNGRLLLESFDVHREAGGANRAVVKTFSGVRPNPHGKIELLFSPRHNNAMVNAIEILDTTE